MEDDTTLPKVKSRLFNRSPLTALFNGTGLFLLGLMLVIPAMILGIVYACMEGEALSGGSGRLSRQVMSTVNRLLKI